MSTGSACGICFRFHSLEYTDIKPMEGNGSAGKKVHRNAGRSSPWQMFPCSNFSCAGAESLKNVIAVVAVKLLAATGTCLNSLNIYC